MNFSQQQTTGETPTSKLIALAITFSATPLLNKGTRFTDSERSTLCCAIVREVEIPWPSGNRGRIKDRECIVDAPTVRPGLLSPARDFED